MFVHQIIWILSVLAFRAEITFNVDLKSNEQTYFHGKKSPHVTLKSPGFSLQHVGMIFH